MAFESGTAYAESDADDEYERSVHAGSPVLATDDEGSASPSASEEGSEGPASASSNEHTPTTYGRATGGGGGGGGDGLPETIVTEWTAEECADFVGAMGLRQYVEVFLGERWAGVGNGEGRLANAMG